MAKNNSNILDFKKFKEHHPNSETSKIRNVKSEMTLSGVIDITEKREAVLASERRKVRRTVLSQFVGVFLVIPNRGLQAANLYDVSETGLSFDLPMESGMFNLGDTTSMRIYVSHDTYFTFQIQITNLRPAESGSGVVRHGAVFSKNDPAFKTLNYFIKFLESVSTISKKDSGDRILGTVD